MSIANTQRHFACSMDGAKGQDKVTPETILTNLSE